MCKKILLLQENQKSNGFVETECKFLVETFQEIQKTKSCKKIGKPKMYCRVDNIMAIVYLRSSSVQDEWIGDKVSGAYGEVAGKFGLYSWCIGRYLSESGDQTSHCFSAESVTRDYIIPVIKFCQIKKISDIFIAMACIHVM